MARSICLITPGHIASTPRLVKAADALSAGGYKVHVVSGCPFPPVDRFDSTVHGKWDWTRVVYHTGPRATLRRVVRRIARGCLVRLPRLASLASPALHIGINALAAAAARIPADLYIGHGGVAGLAAAASAGRARNRAYGFDAEDWHPGETDFVCHDTAERAAVHHMLLKHIPRLAVFTCAAPLIGEAFAQEYGRMPTCILNVFPRAEGPGESTVIEAPSAARPARLHWFSQTIGPGRGLEEAVDLAGHLKTPAVLQLRGFPTPGYTESLAKRLRALNPEQQLQILEPVSPPELARLASGAHLGLSLELSTPPNRNICITNKVFTYLLAGIPQLLSLTAAQAKLAPELGIAALLADPAGTEANASLIDAFLSNTELMNRARNHAWHLANRQFCWDVESEKLLRTMAQALTSIPPAK